MLIRTHATTLLLGLIWFWASSTSARQLESVEIIVCSGDPGFEIANNLNKLVTAFTFLFLLFVPMDEKKAGNLKLIAIELIALTCIPVLVYLAGNFAIDHVCGSLSVSACLGKMK